MTRSMTTRKPHLPRRDHLVRLFSSLCMDPTSDDLIELRLRIIVAGFDGLDAPGLALAESENIFMAFSKIAMFCPFLEVFEGHQTTHGVGHVFAHLFLVAREQGHGLLG